MTHTEPKSEEMWDIIARRELTIKESKITKEIENEKSAQNPFEFEIDALERAANSIYIEAVQKLNTEKMWLIYINFCFERFESTLKSKFINKDVNIRLKLKIKYDYCFFMN